MDFRVVISDPKSGKAYQVEAKDAAANKFLGRKIGDVIDGDAVGMPGYSIEITGGSDREGFPLRRDLPGSKRRKILITGGTGYHPSEQGKRKRKTVHGRDISADVGQINAKITERGAKPVEELLGAAPAE
ncbi:30S ribosomal protein S6e [Methanotrichaceae archaeon M04Ac]|jgi:small subunit ribosomal protein S6e|uniref:Small ribosomal subunit protein eS6 n=1 Tax=Candidatus Methanocrinis alkalitolerans TaxID=3033395 RepID=A0ABT5XD65_9EURY|nr:30S ribosomal protein S6e [Candidatus Methanocrinis alkalitolerans]MDF0592622.1 30S ribosomal protein S6e [Candidatus Methanocrinis alkalitolerans]